MILQFIQIIIVYMKILPEKKNTKLFPNKYLFKIGISNTAGLS
jgi:hypothetical protein